ncbi:MAG: CRISPR-associated endonuclease Cas2 [Epulopiscium sp. Nele67-Bin004]|nr:MAG: CRISPR-associated endonuclease Cas2 [Epulopiscium sp. Nele67-Bin004]
MISPYKSMWLIVSFDISTQTKIDRRRANNFRKDLITLGFIRLQLSIYSKYCYSKDKADRTSAKIKTFLPANGHVTIFFLTDRQFGLTKNFFGGIEEVIEEPEDSMFLF